MEKAKPSYLDRMKEDKEGSPEKEEESKTADVPKREPISGIPNTLTIRKSKRQVPRCLGNSGDHESTGDGGGGRCIRCAHLGDTSHFYQEVSYPHQI